VSAGAELGMKLRLNPPVSSGEEAGSYWGFIDFPRAYFCEDAPDMRDRMMTVGRYCEDGGGVFEFSCHWRAVHGPVFKLEIYSDAMDMLADYPEFMRLLFAGSSDFNDRQAFIDFLEHAGAIDFTETRRGMKRSDLIAAGRAKTAALREVVALSLDTGVGEAKKARGNHKSL
jgi:hypothetical protein